MGCGICKEKQSISNYNLNYSQSIDTNIELSFIGDQKSMFVIHGLIGEGGFGKVLTAVLVKTKKWYAIKEINKVHNS